MTQLSTLTEELSALNAETFEVKDYVNYSEMAFGGSSSTSSCSSSTCSSCTSTCSSTSSCATA